MSTHGNPYWTTGRPGRGLTRAPGLAVVEERGDGPFGGRPVPQWPDREWIGVSNQGGGERPPDENWRRSGKERQDTEMGDSRRRWE
ncbi:MAG: hypothetical protein ACYDCL_16320 [Myxococcales bacterium]